MRERDVIASCGTELKAGRARECMYHSSAPTFGARQTVTHSLTQNMIISQSDLAEKYNVDQLPDVVW